MILGGIITCVLLYGVKVQVLLLLILEVQIICSPSCFLRGSAHYMA